MMSNNTILDPLPSTPWELNTWMDGWMDGWMDDGGEGGLV